jgi:mannose/fructose/N-acetylgalactosamine-specific phosphotransferase system component IIC
VIGLLPGAAAVAALELDAVHAGQTLVSRPFVVGTAIGWLSGDVLGGAALGASFELLGLADVPVCGCLTWSTPVAAGVAALLSGAGAESGPCFLAGLAAGALHARVEAFERARRVAPVAALEAEAAAGRKPRHGLTLGFAMLLHFLLTLALVAGATRLFARPALATWTTLPGALRAGVSAAASGALWIGLAALAVRGFKRA